VASHERAPQNQIACRHDRGPKPRTCVENRKLRHRAEDGRYPFVRLIDSVGSPYPARHWFIQELSALRPEHQNGSKPVDRLAAGCTARLSIDDFRRKSVYGGDGNRIDLAFAVYGLSHGMSEADLSKKGPEHRQAAYIERTIRKACSTLGR
jgi:hypothetical protein